MAESCVFGKQSLGPIRCGRPALGELVPPREAAPLLPKLRGHYAEFLDRGSPDRLGMLYPPTCVGFGTGARGATRAVFLGGMGAAPSHWVLRLASRPRARCASLPCGLPAFTGASRTPRACPSPSPLVSTRRGRYGNVRPLRIGYASRPRLSPRLTLGGLASPRKPWACGAGVSRSRLATHASILAPMPSTGGRPSRFAPHGTLPYRRRQSPRPAASAPCLAPCIVGALPLDQ